MISTPNMAMSWEKEVPRSLCSNAPENEQLSGHKKWSERIQKGIWVCPEIWRFPNFEVINYRIWGVHIWKSGTSVFLPAQFSPTWPLVAGITANRMHEFPRASDGVTHLLAEKEGVGCVNCSGCNPFSQPLLNLTSIHLHDRAWLHLGPSTLAISRPCENSVLSPGLQAVFTALFAKVIQSGHVLRKLLRGPRNSRTFFYPPKELTHIFFGWVWNHMYGTTQGYDHIFFLGMKHYETISTHGYDLFGSWKSSAGQPEFQTGWGRMVSSPKIQGQHIEKGWLIQPLRFDLDSDRL